jgi:hypothetical protein
MKRIITLVVFLLGAIASSSALAWHHHHGGVRFGVFIAPPLFGPWWYSPPPPVYYDPPVIYRRPVVVAAPPPTVIESAPIYSAPAPSTNNGVTELGPVDRPTQSMPKQEPATPRPSGAQPSAPNQSQMALQTQSRQVYVYPRQGQSPQQQAQDEAECNRWASSQMGSGFDATQAVSNFQRALAACLDAHGYSVR